MSPALLNQPVSRGLLVSFQALPVDRCFSETLREDDLFMSCFFIWSFKNVCVCGNVIQHVIWEVQARVLGSKVTAVSTRAGNVPETSLQVWPLSAELSPGEAGAGLGWPLLAHTGSDQTCL